MNGRNWKRMAERHNAAVVAKAPLLASAGLITPLTAAEIRASYERWRREREKTRLREVHFAERCRRLVSLRVSRAELDQLDARRSQLLPASSEYGATSGAEFWPACVVARVRRWAGGEIAS